MIPKESFDANLFQIKFPVDLYNSGLITLKNPTFNQIKFKMVIFQFQNHQFKSTKYCTNKKNEEPINAIFQNLVSSKESLLLIKTHERRRVCFEIKTP